MNAKFASCALLVLALVLTCVDGQLWSFKNPTSALPGVYPSSGVGGTGTPGARYGPAQWKDGSGNIWIFGGTGYGLDPSTEAELNDMWVWNGSTWTFWGGATETDTTVSGFPGYRVNAAAWTDSTGTNLYLYGGFTLTANVYYADLWMFSTSSHTWTLVVNNTNNYAGAFPSSSGQSGSPPGASGQSAWYDSGNFWMFGGTSRNGDYNDLWKYTVGSGGGWTWWNGAKTPGSTSTTNTQPGSRSGGLEFSSSGTLWLFGGITNLNGAPGAYNDMWKYTINGNTWATVAGTTTLNNAGTTNGVGATGVPKSRGYAASWTDTQGGFWLFGGLTQSNGLTDDFWKYSISSSAFTLVAGSTSTNQKDVYAPASSAYPGSRSFVASWVDNIGQLQMFDGNGYGTATGGGALNQFAIYNGAPLLTTSSVSTSSTSSATIASVTSSSSTVSTTNAASTSSTATVGASNLAVTSSGTTLAVSSSSSVSSTSTTTASVSSTTAAAQGAATGSAATSSSTVGVTTTAVAASTSSSSVSSSTAAQATNNQATFTASNQATATTFAASSTSSVSTSITTGGSTVSTQTASISATTSTSAKVSASTSTSATSTQSASTLNIASTTAALSNSFSSSNSVLTGTSSTTSQVSQTTSFATLAATAELASTSSSSSSTASASSTTSKVSSLSLEASSSSTTSTTAGTHVTASITVTTTVATSVTSLSSTTSSSRSTSSSSSLSTTSTSTTAVAGGCALTPIYALAATIAFGALLL